MALTVAQMVARLTADTSGFYRSMAVANASMIRSGSIISRVAAGAGLAITAMGFVSLRAAGNFQESMNILQAVSGASTKQMAALRKESIKLGADLHLPNVSAKDAADAMQNLARSGLSVNDVLKATRGVLQFGLAANIGFADSANIVARSLMAFHLQGQRATDIADLFTAAANKSTAEASDLALGFQMASARFASTGQSIEDLTTSITLMANAGIIGSDAGTSLKTMMNRLVAPTKKAKDLMKEMGFEVYTSSGHVKKMPQLISSLGNALKGMSEEQKNATMYTLFGSDAIRAATVLVDAGAGKFLKMKDAITQGGEAQAFANARTKGFNGALQALGSQVETLAIQLGTRMLPAATQAVQAITRFVGSLDANQIANFAGSILGAARGMAQLVVGTKLGQSAMLGLIGAYLTFKTVVTAATVANRAYLAVLDLMTTTFSRLTVAGAAAAAIVGLAIAMHHFFTETQSASAAAQHYIDTILEMQHVQDAARDATNNLTNAKLNLKQSSIDLSRAEQDVHTALVNGGRSSLDYAQAVLNLAYAKQRHKEAVEQEHTAVNKARVATKADTDAKNEAGNAVEKLRQKYAATTREVSKLSAGQQIGVSKTTAIKAVTQGFVRDLEALAKNYDKASESNRKSHPQLAAFQAKMRDQALATVELTKKLGKVPDAVAKTIPAARAQAQQLGASITGGVMGAVSGLGAQLTSSLVASVTMAIAAAQGAIGAHSPSKLAAEKIGKPIAQGIIKGYLDGTADLPDKVSDRVRKALDKAKAIIDGYRDKLRASFDRLVGDATSAFDAITQQHLTPTEALLAGEESSRAAADRQRTLDDAKRRYEETINDINATDQDRKDAFQAVQDAEWEIRKATLEKQAAEERKQYEASRTMEKRNLEDRLAMLEEQLAKHPEQYRKIQAQIIALLRSYGITYDSVGEALGNAFAAGMWKAFPQIKKVAQQIADTVADILAGRPIGGGGGGGKGGGKKGPTGKPTWGLANDPNAGFTQVNAGAGSGTRSMASTLVVNVNAGTVVGGDLDQLSKDLITPIREEIYAVMRRNGGSVGIN